MTTTTGVTFAQAATILATHLADHPLPEPVILTVTTRWRHSEVAAQLRPNTVPDVAGELLAWIDTLTTVSATAWRPPEGERVHLSVTSILTGPAGVVTLEVYGSAEDDPVRFADLRAGQRRSVSLAELRTWADQPTTTGSSILDTPGA